MIIESHVSAAGEKKKGKDEKDSSMRKREGEHQKEERKKKIERKEEVVYTFDSLTIKDRIKEEKEERRKWEVLTVYEKTGLCKSQFLCANLIAKLVNI